MERMGKREQEIYFFLEKVGMKVFSVDDLVSRGFDKRAVHDSLSSLAKKGIITRVRKGVYVKAGPKLLYDKLQQFESPLLVASKIAEKDYYIGYLSAMQFHGVMEQVPFIVYVATPKRRRNFRYGEYEVRFVNLNRRKFFGYEKVEMAGDRLYVSDREKTIIDCLDRAEYCGGVEEAARLIGELIYEEKTDWDRLADYALRMREQALIHRLGYVLESLGKKHPVSGRAINRLRKMVKPQVYYLSRDEKGRFIKKWQLIAKEGMEIGV
jgi:predicted transcriptional regulator of viral defense system